MSSDKPTILIVDDMKVNLVVLSEILQKDYTLRVAKSGAKALESLSQASVDLILLDVVMPEMDGYELCGHLKKSEDTRDIPIIFVTSNSAAEDEERGFELGAVDYITKPFRPTIIQARVKTHIELYKKQRELQEISLAMQEQNEKLKRYTELIDEEIITSTTDLEGIITEVSTAFCKISGYSKEELLGQKQSIVRHPDFPESFYKQMWETITQDQTWSGEIKNLKKDKNFYWVKASISPIFEKGVKIGYTAIRQDITDKKIIEEISITDGLTNIFNRRYFNETFPKAINGAKRESALLCFLLLDIDHFKQYNDNYGHQAGDDVLIKFAQCLKESLQRAGDLVFRLGGEEFGVIFKALSHERALEFANILRTNIQNLAMTHDYTSLPQRVVTASMGLVCYEAHQIKTMDEIYKEADDLLYASKQSGRNRVSSNAT